MTIAIGRLCTTGLIIATDTRMTWDDGSTYDATKIKSQMTNSGVYVIAHSSEDVNAAETLVSKINLNLGRIDPKSLIGVEDTLRDAMTDWYSPFQQSPSGCPTVRLLVGVFLPSNPSSANADGLGLYFCEPPNTVARKMVSDSSMGYVALGAGLKVTDPLFHTLFETPASVAVCLGQISYLMYRAKKDCAAYCGGDTDAVFLKSEYVEPLWIERIDMAVAESFGSRIDKALARTTSAIIPESENADHKTILTLAGDIVGLGLAYRRMQFRSRTGAVIG